MKVKIYAVIIVLFGAILISETFAEVEVPEEISNTVPIYQGAKVIQSMQMQGSVSAIFEVHDSPKKVIKFYTDTMQPRGWNIVMQMDTENTSIANLSKDNTSLMFNASTDQGEITMLQIFVKTED